MNTKLDLIIDKDCLACKRAEDELTVYTSERSYIELKVSLVGNSEYDKIKTRTKLLSQKNFRKQLKLLLA